MPLILLPIVLASATDALVAIRRIGAFMRAEELSTLYEIDAGAESAIDVDGDFTWEAVRKDENAINLAAKFGDEKKAKQKDVVKKGRKKGGGDNSESLLPTAATTPAEASPARSKENVTAGGGSGEPRGKPEEKPFVLNGVKLDIPKGAFVAIIGPVGSGKVRLISVHTFFEVHSQFTLQSSLLQALIGEMRKTRGQVCLQALMVLAHSCLLTVSGLHLVHLLVSRCLRSADCLDHERDVAGQHHVRSTRG